MANISEEQLGRLLAAIRAPLAGTDKRLTPFSSGEGADWIAWRRNFVAVWRLKGWTEDVGKAQLIAAMEGAACRMVSDIPVDAPEGRPAITATRLLELYGDRFLPPAQSRLARQGFKDAQQRADESITAWHTRVRELYQRAHPEADMENAVELVERFILGLYDSKVKEYSFLGQPTTMAQALTKASDAAATVACLRKTDGFNSRPALHALGTVEKRCFRCDAVGHLIRDCKQPEARVVRSDARGMGVARGASNTRGASGRGRAGGRGGGGGGRRTGTARVGARTGGARRGTPNRRAGGGLAIQSLETGVDADDEERVTEQLRGAAREYLDYMGEPHGLGADENDADSGNE